MANVFRPPLTTRVPRRDGLRHLVEVGRNVALLSAAVLPFAQHAWPNPVVRGAQPVSAAHPRNIALLAFVDMPAPVSLAEVPRSRETRHLVGTQGSSPAFLLTGQKPFAQNSWPNPARAAQTNTGFTLPSRQSAAAAQAPFAKTDWPNPVRAARDTNVGWLNFPPLLNAPPSSSTAELPRTPSHVALRAQFEQQGRALLSQPAGAAPFRPGVPSNPVLAAPRLNTGWVYFPQLFNVPASSAVNEIPRPPSHVALRAQFEQQSSALLSQPVPAPFSPMEFPNPGVPRRSVLLLTNVGWAPLPFDGGLKPTLSYDYPNPRGAAYPTSLRVFSNSLLQSTLAPLQAPFAQADWPVPKGAAFPSSNLGATYSTPLTGYAPVGTPFRQAEWPVPRGYEPNFNRSFAQTPGPGDIPAPPPPVVSPGHSAPVRLSLSRAQLIAIYEADFAQTEQRRKTERANVAPPTPPKVFRVAKLQRVEGAKTAAVTAAHTDSALRQISRRAEPKQVEFGALTEEIARIVAAPIKDYSRELREHRQRRRHAEERAIFEALRQLGFDILDEEE